MRCRKETGSWVSQAARRETGRAVSALGTPRQVVCQSPAKASPAQGVRSRLRAPGGTWSRGPRGGGALTKPAVGHHTDEVLRGQWLKDRHEERDEVLVLGILGLEQEVLMVQDHLTVHVLHENPEGL